MFRILRGVVSVRTGFSGGSEADPSYEDVKAQKTEHRETVCVAYDADVVTFGELLDVFLSGVDLYDGGGKGAIPFDKLEAFFNAYLQ